MKFIKIFGKTGLAVVAIAYAACLFNDITVISYSVKDEGGVLSIAGHTVEINNGIAGDVLEAYVQAERRAARWLPEKIKSAVEYASNVLNGE